MVGRRFNRSHWGPTVAVGSLTLCTCLHHYTDACSGVASIKSVLKTIWFQWKHCLWSLVWWLHRSFLWYQRFNRCWSNYLSPETCSLKDSRVNRPMLSFRGVGLTDAVEFFHLDSHCTARIRRSLGIGWTDALRLHRCLCVDLTGAAVFFLFSAEWTWNWMLLRLFEFPCVLLSSLSSLVLSLTSVQDS